MSEPAEDLRSLDSQPYAEAASAQARSEFLNSWAQHLSTTDSPPIDENTGIQRIFLAHDTVVDYKPVEATKHSFALGADYLTAGNHRTLTQRVEDFTQAAVRRLADPEEQKVYAEGQINKVIGIGEGLNAAKEDVKATAAAGLQALTAGTAVKEISSTAAAGWRTVTDGKVTRFMAQPNAVNNVVSHAAADALNTIPELPQATGKNLEALDNSIAEANNRFNALTPKQQGKFLGEMMFFGFTPEGEPEALNELATARNLEREIVNPIDSTADNAEKVRQLVKLSHSNEGTVRQFIEPIDREFDAKSTSNFKDPEKIAEKAERPEIKKRKPWFGVEHIRDALRFKTVLGDLNDLPAIAKKLKDSDFGIIKVDTERLLRPSERGWRMAAFDLRTPNGQLVEYQIVPRELEAVDKETHDIYEKWRTKDVSALSQTEQWEKDADYYKAAELSNNAWKQYLTRTGQTEKKVAGYVAKTREVLE